MTERERLYELIVDADNEFFRETPYGTAQERIEKTVEHLIKNGVILTNRQSQNSPSSLLWGCRGMR